MEHLQLNDVIAGLSYLHSANIVHGDLCGRNILIDERGTAYLSDFGLAGLIQSEPALGSSTRGGSTRWMGAELLFLPPGVTFKRATAPDVWAFGCVYGEIWTEGTPPFSQFSHDTVIVTVFSDARRAIAEQPYQNRPSDKPESL
ncbi:kinase-like domain-containing protein [Mycena olivaceomarginata]|nr:kinase-like domain-containing protein [Mycena olivaceomarginata]